MEDGACRCQESRFGVALRDMNVHVSRTILMCVSLLSYRAGDDKDADEDVEKGFRLVEERTHGRKTPVGADLDQRGQGKALGGDVGLWSSWSE